jgi:transposase
MEALSLDLRERICVACDERFETRAEVAERFGVSRSFVQKLLRRRKKTGSVEAKPHAGGPEASVGDRDRKRLRKLVKDDPDATLSELCRSLAATGGASVSVPTMCRTLAKLRLRLKKRRFTPRSGIRRASVRCGGIGRNAWRRWTPESWSSWTRAGSTLP